MPFACNVRLFVVTAMACGCRAGVGAVEPESTGITSGGGGIDPNVTTRSSRVAPPRGSGEAQAPAHDAAASERRLCRVCRELRSPSSEPPSYRSPSPHRPKIF